MQTNDVSSSLKDMGFTDDQITLALKHSQDKSLEGLINWIDANPNLEKFLTEPSSDTQMNIEKPQGEDTTAQTEGQSISNLVNQEMAKELESMGYSKNVREKALLMTGNSGIEKALEWIEEHRNDADFEEEMRIIAQQEEKKLSPEEAAEKARELQQLIRERRKKREEEEALERERNRISSGKALAEAKRALQEAEKQRSLDLFMKQKQEDEAYKKKLMEEYEKERIARFGKEHATASKAQQGEKPEDKLNTALKQMKIVYPLFNYPDTIKVCLTTIKTILGNILKNPSEQKFQKINLSNENFKNRVGDIIGGIFMLQTCGFQEEEGFLVLKDQEKIKFFPKAIEIFDRELTNLNV